MDRLIFRQGTATAADIESHLRACSADFSPPLEDRVDLPMYASKLSAAATTYEAWDGEELVGLIALYRNDATGFAFITSVSTVARYRRSGLARTLLGHALADLDGSGARQVELEVDSRSEAAISLYQSANFEKVSVSGSTVRMSRPGRASGSRGTEEREGNEPLDE
jgi:ribosomal protein S18 acetylase RimI-like enzyme